MLMEILRLKCILNYMIHALFPQCCIWTDIYIYIYIYILKKEVITIGVNCINYMYVYRNKTWYDIGEIENRRIDNYVTKWKTIIEKMHKLKTYIMFKHIFKPETYIIKCMSRRRRSLMSQFRTGILPLEIETGRYVPIFDKTLKKNKKRTANESFKSISVKCY